MVPPVEIFGYLGLIPTFAMFGLPLLAIRDAWKSPEPLVTSHAIDPMLGMLANCCVWISYGFVAANPIILICNFGGLLVSLLGIVVYAARTKKAEQKRQYMAIGIISLIILAILIIEHTLVPPQRTLLVCGLIASGGSLVLFGSGLAMTRQIWVLKDSSIASLPAQLGMLSSAVWWTVYGVWKGDPYIWFCNGVGILTTGFSLFTFFKFRHPTEAATPQAAGGTAGVPVEVSSSSPQESPAAAKEGPGGGSAKSSPNMRPVPSPNLRNANGSPLVHPATPLIPPIIVMGASIPGGGSFCGSFALPAASAKKETSVPREPPSGAVP
jgi:hypothetical protein